MQNRLIEANKLILVNGLATKMGIYVAPPEKSREQLTFPYPVAVNSHHFDPSTLEPLLRNGSDAMA